MKALRIPHRRARFCPSPARRATLSTTGLLLGLELAGPTSRLACPTSPSSLHAPTDVQRGQLVPINKKYGIGEIIEACKQFPLKRRGRITFGYVMLADVNDKPEDARHLAKLLAGVKSKVNLIPLYAAPGTFLSAPRIRRSTGSPRFLGIEVGGCPFGQGRGRDIRAACGQLIVEGQRKSSGCSSSPRWRLASLFHHGERISREHRPRLHNFHVDPLVSGDPEGF